jgi:hypothetical protein
MEWSIMSHKPSNDEQTRQIREWAAAYRVWNAQELRRRQERAGQESVEEKLASFFDLCEAMFQIAPSKSAALYLAQLQSHGVERARISYFEQRQAFGKSGLA